MRRCPTCNKTFTDQSLKFCIDDGTPLVEIELDDELTEVRPGGSSAPYQPPSYVPPGAGGSQRKTWPWVVGILGLLVIALVGFTVAAVVFVPKMMKKANESAAANNNSNSNSSPNTNSEGLNENTNTENTNAANTNSANTNSDPTVTVPPPTDKEIVLAQLKDLEHEWTVANINADKKKLAQILADDYVSAGTDGRMIGKAEYIRTIQRDTETQSWDFEDLRLTLRGDRATLLGKVRFKVAKGERAFDFVDRFVWRDGRWQATGSEITPLNQ